MTLVDRIVNGTHEPLEEWAAGKTLEECREGLLSALEDWILFRIHRHLLLPVIDGIELAVKAEAAS